MMMSNITIRNSESGMEGKDDKLKTIIILLNEHFSLSMRIVVKYMHVCIQERGHAFVMSTLAPRIDNAYRTMITFVNNNHWYTRSFFSCHEIFIIIRFKFGFFPFPLKKAKHLVYEVLSWMCAVFNSRLFFSSAICFSIHYYFKNTFVYLSIRPIFFSFYYVSTCIDDHRRLVSYYY